MDESDVEYAGFWIRVWASVIDTILLMLVTYPLLIAVYGWAGIDYSRAMRTTGFVDILLSWVLPIAAIVWFWMQKQATPGKMLLSLRVVDAQTGKALTFAQSIGRYVSYFISGIPFGLGFIWVAFDRRKQGWHDKLAGTVVIRDKKRGVEAVKFPQA